MCRRNISASGLGLGGFSPGSPYRETAGRDLTRWSWWLVWLHWNGKNAMKERTFGAESRTAEALLQALVDECRLWDAAGVQAPSLFASVVANTSSSFE